MKIINIPSVNNEECNATFKFHEKKYDLIPWKIEFECSTPSFNAKVDGHVEDEDLKRFITDLKKVEKERKGECQFYDEWGFSFTIRSIDSVGHFVVKIAIWSQGTWHQGDGDLNDTMNISYEIEPSLLIKLLEDFEQL